MRINRTEVSVRDLVDAYSDDAEGGVTGYGGRLDIRPPFQREFVYELAQQEAVIRTVLNDWPRNVMYWTDRGSRADGRRYEIIDGQQRTISLCSYVAGDFSYDDGRSGPRGFDNLTPDLKERILDYRLDVYVCEGDDSVLLDWFEIINIAGVTLTAQELRNAVYGGPWTADAKRYFSRAGAGADRYGNRNRGGYLKGNVNRQEFLETAIAWAARGKDDSTIHGYMAECQQHESAEPLWDHFRAVVDWVEQVFPQYRREMKGIDWGRLHREHAAKRSLSAESDVAELMADDDVTAKRGIFEYVLTSDERHLNIRRFSDGDKRSAYERQNGECVACGNRFEIGEMDGDHITPWSEGGKTVHENCQMLCRECNLRKGAR